MKRSHYPLVAFAVVEGEDDKSYYERHTYCRAVVAHGHPNVLDSIRHLRSNPPFAGAFGIIDADFARLNKSVVTDPDIIVTDFHDLEIALLVSPALDHVLSEFGNSDAVAAFEAARGPLRDVLFELATPLAYLRWASSLQGWSLKFEGIDFGTFISEKTLEIDTAAMLNTVRSHQGGGVQPPLDTVLASAIDGLHGNGPYPSSQLCRGHDVVEILSIGLRRLLGKRTSSEVAPDRLERALRLASERIYFRATNVWKEMHKWEQRNVSFKACCP